MYNNQNAYPQGGYPQQGYPPQGQYPPPGGVGWNSSVGKLIFLELTLSFPLTVTLVY